MPEKVEEDSPKWLKEVAEVSPSWAVCFVVTQGSRASFVRERRGLAKSRARLKNILRACSERRGKVDRRIRSFRGLLACPWWGIHQGHTSVPCLKKGGVFQPIYRAATSDLEPQLFNRSVTEIRTRQGYVMYDVGVIGSLLRLHQRMFYRELELRMGPDGITLARMVSPSEDLQKRLDDAYGSVKAKLEPTGQGSGQEAEQVGSGGERVHAAGGRLVTRSSVTAASLTAQVWVPAARRSSVTLATHFP